MSTKKKASEKGQKLTPRLGPPRPPFFFYVGTIGSLLRLQMGSQHWLSITDPAMAHEVLAQGKFKTMRRPHHQFIDEYYSHNRKGIVYSDDDREGYKKLKEIIEEYLLSPIVDDNNIRVQIQDLARYFAEKQTFMPLVPLKVVCRTLFCSIAYAKEFHHGSDDIKEAEQVIDRCFPLLGVWGDPSAFFPFFKYIPGLSPSKATMEAAGKKLDSVIDDWFKETVDKESHCLVKQLEAKERQPNSGIDMTDIRVAISDMSGMAGDLIPVALMWIIGLLANHRDAQTRVRDELNRFLAENGHLPRYNERHLVPTVVSTQRECMRYRCSNLYSVPRKFEEEVTMQGITIPPGTVIVVPFYSMHRNGAFYDDPTEFIPERFNDPAVQSKLVDDRNTFQYGFGPRKCPAAEFTEKVLFIAFVELFHRFEFYPPTTGDDGQPVPIDLTQTTDTGVMLRPPLFDVSVRDLHPENNDQHHYQVQQTSTSTVCYDYDSLEDAASSDEDENDEESASSHLLISSSIVPQ
ncbi:cytochrome P450 [Gongronella butleri]|nr:cytochrome P450 [Gongronella butleri]